VTAKTAKHSGVGGGPRVEHRDTVWLAESDAPFLG
jgi:hypothetical protein